MPTSAPQPHPGHPHDRPGTEARNARSPLRLRLVLACFGLAFFGAAAIAFGVAASRSESTAPFVGCAVCVIVAVTAALDAIVIERRIRRGDTG